MKMGLSQTELANRIGSSGGWQISNWERGTQKPTPGWLEKLEEVLEIHKGSLMREASRPGSHPVAGLNGAIPFPEEQPFIPLWPEGARILCVDTEEEAARIALDKDFPIQHVQLAPGKILLLTIDVRALAGLPLKREEAITPTFG
jgi:transcriptional regulator with XRE-family HTH domain